MTNKEQYEEFIETSRRNTAQVDVPKDFTQGVMNRIYDIENTVRHQDAGRSAVVLRWRIAAAGVSSAAAALLLFGLFSVNSPREAVSKPSDELASRKIPVLTLEERIEIYRQTSSTAEFIAEWNK